MTARDLPMWQQGGDGTWFHQGPSGWLPSSTAPSQSPDGTWWVKNEAGVFAQVEVQRPAPDQMPRHPGTAPRRGAPEAQVPAGWTPVPTNDPLHRRSVGPFEKDTDGTYSISMMCSCGWQATARGDTEKECRKSAFQATEEHQHGIRQHQGTGTPEARTIFWISALFGIFGLIPAAVYANAAARDGRPSNGYWSAFLNGILLSAVLWAVLIAVAISK